MARYLYEKYIHSEAWSEKKKDFKDYLRHCNSYHCYICKIKYGIMHVHHLNYKSLGQEEFYDLRLVCENCHNKLHNKNKKKKNKGMVYTPSTGGMQKYKTTKVRI